MLNGGGGILYNHQKAWPEGWALMWPNSEVQSPCEKAWVLPRSQIAWCLFNKHSQNKYVYVLLVMNRRTQKNRVQGCTGVRGEVYLVGVLVSCGCCNTFPQTGWLKIREIHSLTEARSPRSRFGQGCALLASRGGSREGSRGAPREGSLTTSSSFWGSRHP